MSIKRLGCHVPNGLLHPRSIPRICLSLGFLPHCGLLRWKFPCQVPLVLALCYHTTRPRPQRMLRTWRATQGQLAKLRPCQVFPSKSGGSCHECLLVQLKWWVWTTNTEIYCHQNKRGGDGMGQHLRFSELEVAESPRKLWAKSPPAGAMCNWGGNPIVGVDSQPPKKRYSNHYVLKMAPPPIKQPRSLVESRVDIKHLFPNKRLHPPPTAQAHPDSCNCTVPFAASCRATRTEGLPANLGASDG